MQCEGRGFESLTLHVFCRGGVTVATLHLECSAFGRAGSTPALGTFAEMVELVDTLDSKLSVLGREGSTPSFRICSRSPTEEALGLSSGQCGFESHREYFAQVVERYTHRYEKATFERHAGSTPALCIF